MVQSISKKSLLFLTLFSLVIAAPPGDDDTILGKWELDPGTLEKAVVEAVQGGEEVILATAAIEVAVVVVEFNEDGTYVSSETAAGETKTVKGTWKLDGTSLSILPEDSEEWNAAEITLGEGQLVIANEDETLVFKRSE